MRAPRPIDHSLVSAPGRHALDEGTAGQSRVLTWGGVAGADPFVELFSVHGAADRAQALALTLLQPTGIQGLPLAGAAEEFDVEARVVFGVHGVSHEARLDFLAGSRVEVVAGFLRLEARVQDSSSVAGSRCRVGAMAARGLGGTTQAQRTLRTTVGAVGEGAPANQTFVRIPPFAKGVSIMVQPVSAAGGYTITWFDAAGGSVGTYNFPTGAAAFGTGPGPEAPSDEFQVGARAGLPVPSRAKFCQLDNGGAARTAVNFIFEVQL